MSTVQEFVAYCNSDEGREAQRKYEQYVWERHITHYGTRPENLVRYKRLIAMNEAKRFYLESDGNP